jgi:predicted nucleotidyltransferase
MKDITTLRNYLVELFPEASVFLFGSRARGDAKPYSDIDIAIRSERPLRRRLTIARDTIERSAFPYKVDLVDLQEADYLADVVEREGIRWN